MKAIKASFEVLKPNIYDPDVVQGIYRDIEAAGRTCYQSAGSTGDGTAERIIDILIRNHHEAMLEHASITVRFTVDRGVSHELVRHRIASFAQESTRYCNYSKGKFSSEITTIEPCFFTGDGAFQKMGEWYLAMQDAERHYFALLEMGATPQEARGVLPTSLKTEIVVTTNIREWRHFLKLRAAGETGAPHPQMAEVAIPLLKDFQRTMPELFGDIRITEELQTTTIKCPICKERNCVAIEDVRVGDPIYCFCKQCKTRFPLLGWMTSGKE